MTKNNDFKLPDLKICFREELPIESIVYDPKEHMIDTDTLWRESQATYDAERANADRMWRESQARLAAEMK